MTMEQIRALKQQRSIVKIRTASGRTIMGKLDVESPLDLIRIGDDFIDPAHVESISIEKEYNN